MLESVEIKSKANSRWRRFYENRCLTLAHEPIINSDDVIFTMGSCFAREIRFSLRDRGFAVGPDLSDITLEHGRYTIDDLPQDEHLNYYNTFTMRQEFERLAGRWEQSPDDYWQLERSPRAGLNYQDPYKRLVFGRTPEDLQDAIDLVNQAIGRAAREARVFFFTLGMAEVFRKFDNGRVAGQKPAYLGGAGEKETAFMASTVAENLENLEQIRGIIREINPEAQIVVTVSPVPLERTFSENDIVVANVEGKSILRAAAAEFSASHSDVLYFPAYEIVTVVGEPAFQARDLRHVGDVAIRLIMDSFVNTHVANALDTNGTDDLTSG